ncbi:sulfotransferase [Paraglaciecola sp. L1A13]|uniref:tetratricopeptide repeat-containing sulfotransferase family protein n=1 Tax=Paraglaciecola sp. L1A13 TaxID=2686359 RepID=UPI00131B0CAB|nr:sulfotransferase [Paraglaciecola sp. L1A13]
MQEIKQLHQQAITALNKRDFAQAHSLSVQIIKHDPSHSDAYFLLAMVNIEVGQIAKSIKLLEKALSLSTHVEYWVYLAKCYSLRGEAQRVLHAVEQAPLLQVNSPLALDTFGVALSRVGLHEKALQYFAKALLVDKDNAQFCYNFAVSSKFAGQFAIARVYFERAITLAPDYHQAHFALSDLGGVSAQANHVARLQATAKRTKHVDASLHIAHALAKEYEAFGQYHRAFESLQAAKRDKLNSLTYTFHDDEMLFNSVQQTQLSAPSSKEMAAGQGHASDQPIFVLGMPRSGTTLVERILSNHSDVLSAGELQDFGVAVKELSGTSSPNVLDVATLQKAMLLPPVQIAERYLERTLAVVGNTPRFVDKLPFNFFYIGLIRRAFPNAKIVCLLRNPMDTCIGNYRQLFSLNSPYYAYAYDLENIGKFYARFHQLVHEWQARDTNNFTLLNYEQLVSEPQKNIEQLLHFCNLPWQSQCLHVEQNQAPVSTASKVQVREAINRKSIGNWRKYQPYTEVLQALFKREQINIET